MRDHSGISICRVLELGRVSDVAEGVDVGVRSLEGAVGDDIAPIVELDAGLGNGELVAVGDSAGCYEKGGACLLYTSPSPRDS